MSIIELGALGEFIGSVLVLGTLVYLIVQVRQTRLSINSANVVNATQMFNPVNLAALSDPDFFSIFLRGMNEPELLSEEEASRFHLLLRAYNNNYHSLHTMDGKGALPAGFWKIYERNYAEILSTPGGSRLIKSLEFAAPEWAKRLAELRDLIGAPMAFTKDGYQLANPHQPLMQD